MARDALQIMLRTFVGLLSALAFSSGIFIGRGEGGIFPHNDSYLDPGPQTRILGAESPDLTYCNMILDAPVPPTADQVPWFCTCTLCKGDNTEPKGDRGDRGLPGPPGCPGRRGLTGSQGPPGLRGPPGVKGHKGEEGTQGAQGPSGFLGKKGQHGIKGEKGDMGIEGRPGDLGPAGEPGDCPASCDYVRGPPGDVGLPGIVGPRGLPGPTGIPGAKGHKGDKGDIGQPGAQGVEGVKGDQGIQGVCTCKNGTKGTSGEQGIAGSKGEKGDLGLQGQTGVGGVKGDKGELGMTGIPGPCSPAIQSAFSAKLVNIYPVPDQPVPFAAVIYNAQFHYSPSTGVYRAPVNGTYVFSYHLVAYGKTLKVGLFLNFKPVVKSTEIVNFGTVSQHVVLHLSMGDQLWLQVKDVNNNGLYAGPEFNSVFSGFLLYPDSCDMPLSRNLFPEIVDYNYSSGPYSWDIE